jgi:rhodanese-related sulfurtransferase
MPTVYTLAAALLFTVLPLTAACTRSVTERDIVGLDLPEVIDAVDHPRESDLLLDARAPSRYRDGHLPRAVSLGIADVRLGGRPRPDLIGRKRLIVYGQNPGDTLATGLTLRLIEAGYGGVMLFRGGIDEWTGIGRTLITDAGAVAP